MNWAWATSLDQFWRSPSFPMWLTLAAAGFFAIIAIIMLIKADKSVANGALTVITLLAIGIAAAATSRGFGRGGAGEISSAPPATAALPALSCIDDLAGDAVLAACEKALFGSPEAVAAALSYAATQITFVTSLGDAAAGGSMTTGQLAVRRAVERDRYGLMAYVLAARDHCTVSECSAFRVLTNRQQIVTNMDERVYEGMISRYAPSWNAPAVTAPVAVLSSSLPTGKPTNADFPSAASTPPVNIMTPEPGTTPAAASRPPASLANAPLPSSRPASTAAAAPAAAKKQAAPKPARAPTQLSPPPAPATAPAASND
jgi:hypothetical protein